MEPTQIIIKPLVTEKGTWESEVRNRYAFQVHPEANKFQIRDAVQRIYNVRVVKVATQTRHGKARRTKFGVTPAAQWKRAVVQLHQEDKIELF
jgi:large subunit ribosomal protein L23